ncbi:MAG: hypothetical protein KAR42_16035 [candidate division Zixibacteria bacterium]|nr:hypothetical protein [candidate division Zixibacteria bacterium]
MTQSIRFGEFWYLYFQVIRQMLKITLWFPVLIQGAIALGLAVIHNQIFSPFWGPALNSWVGLLYPEAVDAFFRYPEHYMIFPMIFSGSARVLNFLSEAFLFGIFCDMLISLYKGEKPAFMLSARRALSKYLKLTATWAVLLVILFIVSKYFYVFLEDVIGYSLHTAPRRQFLAMLLLHGVNVFIYTFFIFVIPSIMLGGESWAHEVSRGIKTSIKHPIAAFCMITIPYSIAAIPSLPLFNTRKIIEVFNPELVYQILLVAIGINIIANFVLIGTSVKFFMDKSE